MENFAFVLHPLEAMDFARKYSIARKISPTILEGILKYIPPIKVSHISGISSAYSQAEGWFIACPLTSRQMIDLPEPYVINKIIKAGRLAEKMGAKILGLGAFTSVVGDAGITIAKNLDIPTTTGNSYTVATAIEGTKKAAQIMGLDLKKANVVILGATGSIGAACAQLLAREVKYITLVARNEFKLEKVAEKIYADFGLAVRISSNNKMALKSADIVIAVTSAVDNVIEVDDLKSGAIVCDVARPRNISRKVAQLRNDILVIEGGVVEVPGDVDFGFSFGFPEKMAYACMAETMILALEGRYESFTLGRDLTIRQIEIISQLAKKHGFQLAGLRSFERAITDYEINQIKNNITAARNGKARRDAG
ncbi:NAD(P)-binding domain-containing protein [Anaerosinus massiliensis]|uniref:NAD(P)-binding domain-containing protein n=1 Tax=Massilibacillus massiliensis TaxID=1806837 RepID=UPI000A9C1981|nr:NAD(P)-binding domain-containing protein [Massilibacillus massiliensis]